MTGHTMFEIRWKNALDLRTNHKLKVLKQQLTNLLICSIHSNLRYTGYFTRPN